MSAKPHDTSGMESEDKRIHSALASSNSMAGKIADGSIANEYLNAAAPDPLLRLGIKQDTEVQLLSKNRGVPSNGSGGMVMSGVAAAPVIKIGSRIYHKLKKKEGLVKDISAMGKVDVDFDDGNVGRVKLENLVAL